MRRIIINTVFLCISCAVTPPAWAQFLDRDTWWQCPADRDLPIRPLYTETLESGSTEIRADATRMVQDGVTQFSGDVELVQDVRSIAGDIVTYDESQSLVNVEGNATIWDAGLIWRGEQGLFNLDSNIGQLNSGNYWLTNGRGRGHAGVIESDRGENISVLEDVDYTTCPKQRPAWWFSASKIKLDHDEGRGAATHALLKVRSVPVFYFPYFTFPLDDRRKSGFLMPTIGTSNESGFDVKVPYYFNLAPNHDATFSPRVLAKRGVMLGGQYRYKQKKYRGQFGIEYMPGDKLANDRDRSLFSFRHEQFFAGHQGWLEADFQNVSDAQYFEDFGRSLSVTSQRYLDRRVEMRYRKRGKYNVRAIVQSYQQVDDSRGAGRGPYRRLPQINFSTADSGRRHMRLKPDLDAQTVYFYRNGSVSGGRVDVYPSISLPYIKHYARITPKFGVRHTEYFLNGKDDFDSRESRTVPVASFDSRLFAERRLSLFGLPMLQTLEPRAYYVYTPKVGQDAIPDFDASAFDIRFRNLFRENRFTGVDRIGDANRISLAATTRFIRLDSGREIFRASLGQIYYFEDREINLPGIGTQKDSVSDIVSEFATNLGNGVSARAILQYDPNDSNMKRSSYSLNFRPSGTGIVLNGSYRRQENRQADIEQTDVSFRMPVGDSIHLLGRWNYSLEKSQTLELVGGVEYETCCWGARLVGRRFIRNTEREFDTGIFVQFEFKGLAGYGRGTESFLRKSIPGYESYF